MRQIIQPSLARYERVLAENPNDSRAWYPQGFQLVRLERYQEALAAFDQAQALEPGDSFSLARQEALECCEAGQAHQAAYESEERIKQESNERR